MKKDWPDLSPDSPNWHPASHRLAYGPRSDPPTEPPAWAADVCQTCWEAVAKWNGLRWEWWRLHKGIPLEDCQHECHLSDGPIMGAAG